MSITMDWRNFREFNSKVSAKENQIRIMDHIYDLLFSYFGRLKHVKTSVREVRNTYKRMNYNDETYVQIAGRIVFDMLPLFLRHDRGPHGKGGFKLNSVSTRHLSNLAKDDVAYTDIER